MSGYNTNPYYQTAANPNMIIQQMLNSGMANQQMYESARQSAGAFNRR